MSDGAVQRFDIDEAQEVRPQVVVVSRGPVPLGAINYARRKVNRVIEQASRPVLFARVTLQRHADPARELPALVEVSLDVEGRIVRAHREAHDFREAIDLTQERLQDRLKHLADHRRSRVRGKTAPDE